MGLRECWCLLYGAVHILCFGGVVDDVGGRHIGELGLVVVTANVLNMCCF